MGLDMFLTGFYRDGKEIELAYWRKHPDLHGFVVRTFANGVDDCEPIELTADDLKLVLKAAKEGKLPKTTGFFFGDSGTQDTLDTIERLRIAIAWLEDGTGRKVVYQASW